MCCGACGRSPFYRRWGLSVAAKRQGAAVPPRVSFRHRRRGPHAQLTLTRTHSLLPSADPGAPLPEAALVSPFSQPGPEGKRQKNTARERKNSTRREPQPNKPETPRSKLASSLQSTSDPKINSKSPSQSRPTQTLNSRAEHNVAKNPSRYPATAQINCQPRCHRRPLA